MAKTLAVIVLNYNDAKTTTKYVNCIKNYDCIDKIIVVDNLSPDGSYELLKPLKSDKVDVIVTDGNKGYAYGNNYAIRYLNQTYGEYKYITISNSDIEVSEKAFQQCISFLDSHPKVAIAAPRMYDINNNPHPLSGWKLRTLKGDIISSSLLLTELFQTRYSEYYPANVWDKKVTYVDCVAGSFFLIRHSIFQQVGYFDENTFLYYEEDILGNKLKNMGYYNVILNNCKFKHYESVTIDKNLNYMKKYKNLQKSRRYYHEHYNRARKGKKGLFLLDFFTKFRSVEEKSLPIIHALKIDKAFRKIRGVVFMGTLLKITKLILLFVHIILLPITWLIKKLRRRQKVLYFSLVTWKWIKQRPHFVAMELATKGNYDVDYRYQELYKRYMPNDKINQVNNKVNIKHFHIKAFKIFPANSRWRTTVNSIWSVIRTSFWNYDKIILTNPNQTDFFFMKLQVIKGTKIYYECMDNYEGWEPNVAAFRDKQNSLIRCSEHVIVSADKLKNKLIKMCDCKDKITVVRNGYDHCLFENYKKTTTNLQHPNIVYIGTVDDWFDFESIAAFGKNNPNFHIDIIGPINNAVKEETVNLESSNIKFHGPIEHDLVPQYIENSDVLIMPFLINEIIEYVDPVKVYEYLYMKKPVVTTYWEELNQFKDMVYFYSGPKEFDTMIKKAIKNGFKESKEYDKLMKESKWQERLKKYIRVIQ